MRKAVASPFEGSHALCVRKTDYRRALMLSACLTANLASGGARAQQTLPDIQIGEAGPSGPSAPAPYTVAGTRRIIRNTCPRLSR